MRMGQAMYRSCAKVNLTLDVLGKRPEDGYHFIRTLMVPVSLCDTIYIEDADGVEVECFPPVGEEPRANLAWRAADLLKRATGYLGGARIRIEKRIPVAGGLAGGSSNAGTVLMALNSRWGTGLTTSQLMSLAIQIGSDVPFFLIGRPALVEGIGERVTPITMDLTLTLVLAFPGVAKSTGNVYRLFDGLEQVDRPDTAEMVKALHGSDLRAVAARLGNVFEQVMLPRHPEIGALKASMLEHGALGAVMSGAGPSVLGLVEEHEAPRLREALSAFGAQLFVVKSLPALEGPHA